MNQQVIIGTIVVLLAAGGYYQFSYKPEMERQAALTVKPAVSAAAVSFPLEGNLILQCKVVDNE